MPRFAQFFALLCPLISWAGIPLDHLHVQFTPTVAVAALELDDSSPASDLLFNTNLLEFAFNSAPAGAAGLYFYRRRRVRA